MICISINVARYSPITPRQPHHRPSFQQPCLAGVTQSSHAGEVHVEPDHHHHDHVASVTTPLPETEEPGKEFGDFADYSQIMDDPNFNLPDLTAPHHNFTPTNQHFHEDKSHPITL